MNIKQLSTSVSLIEDAEREELRTLQETYRNQFVESCERAPDARVPSQQDLDYWWPLTAKASLN